MKFSNDFTIVQEALGAYWEECQGGDVRVINQTDISHIMEVLELGKWCEHGGLQGQNLKAFLGQFLGYHTRLHHSGYLGHQCAAPNPMAALGSVVNSFTNNVPSIYEMGPASVAIELFLINWMLDKVGWEPIPVGSDDRFAKLSHGSGVLVNGGSIANLTALITARTRMHPDVWQQGNSEGLAILLPSESHYSLTKSAGILGIGKKAVHLLEVDGQGAIVPDKLPQLYQKVQAAGQQPFVIVANACNTAVGIYDPLDEIADFCQEHELWFHVDGAHGASALLSEKHRHKLKGAVRADSLVWDAHKLLQVPSLCAALLVKNQTYLERAMPVEDNASYLFHDKKQPGMDTLHRTIETTKPGLGERLFFVLGAMGEQSMANFIDRQYQLAMEAYRYLNNLDDFVCPVEPQSNILCFRYTGSPVAPLVLREKILASGEFYLTTTLFKGVRYLRLVFMSPNTKLEHIKRLVDSVRSLAKITS
nr:aminotransferase class V-fold PLP-dependent enzyme [Allomuricauda sp.]